MSLISPRRSSVGEINHLLGGFLPGGISTFHIPVEHHRHVERVGTCRTKLLFPFFVEMIRVRD